MDWIVLSGYVSELMHTLQHRGESWQEEPLCGRGSLDYSISQTCVSDEGKASVYRGGCLIFVCSSHEQELDYSQPVHDFEGSLVRATRPTFLSLCDMQSEKRIHLQNKYRTNRYCSSCSLGGELNRPAEPNKAKMCNPSYEIANNPIP